MFRIVLYSNVADLDESLDKLRDVVENITDRDIALAR
jgi:hypothetical protein